MVESRNARNCRSDNVELLDALGGEVANGRLKRRLRFPVCHRWFSRAP